MPTPTKGLPRGYVLYLRVKYLQCGDAGEGVDEAAGRGIVNFDASRGGISRDVVVAFECYCEAFDNLMEPVAGVFVPYSVFFALGVGIEMRLHGDNFVVVGHRDGLHP